MEELIRAARAMAGEREASHSAALLGLRVEWEEKLAAAEAAGQSSLSAAAAEHEAAIAKMAEAHADELRSVSVGVKYRSGTCQNGATCSESGTASSVSVGTFWCACVAGSDGSMCDCVVQLGRASGGCTESVRLCVCDLFPWSRLRAR